MSEHLGIKSKESGGILVRDIMNKSVVTLQDTASINEAARAMKRKGVGCVVVKKGSDLFGMVTERDVIKILGSDRIDVSTVADIVSKPIISVRPEDSVNEAARILAEKGIRRLPVVDGTRLVGILTSTDLVKFYEKLSKYMMKGVGP